MDITEALLTKGAGHGRTCAALSPEGVAVHYVGNPLSSAAANRNWFESGADGAYTSCHYIVGLAGEILRLIPENEQAMHAGKAYAAGYESLAAKNNRTLIGIECCHPDAGGRFNNLTTDSLVRLLKDICGRHGFPRGRVYRHYDVTGKVCPLYYVRNPEAWENLLDLVFAGNRAVISYMGRKTAVEAENINGSYWITLRELERAAPEISVPVRSALEAAGMRLSYDGNAKTIRIEANNG